MSTKFNKLNEDDLDSLALGKILTGISSDIANLQLPDPFLRNQYLDEANRVIWITDTIDDATLDVVKKIVQYNKEDKNVPVEQRKPIRIFIDTPGGAVAVMWTIVQTIKISKTPVWTINMCEAMSAGAHILAAGHKRFGFPGSTVLIHSGSCQFGGTVEQADSAKKYYDSVAKLANDQLIADTHINMKLFKKKAPSDWYLSETEALNYGIIDKIIHDLDVIM